MSRRQIEEMFRDITSALAKARRIDEGDTLTPELERVQLLLMDRIWEEDLASDRAEAIDREFRRDRDEMFAVK